MPLNATFSAASKRGFTSFEQDFWIPTQTLTANSPSAGDGFGYSIAMDDNSLYLAVTAPNEITSSNKGSVYVFYRGTGSWVLQQEITSPVSSTSFGLGQLDMDANGVYLAIPDFTLNKVYIYIRSGTTWSLQATLTGSDTVAGDTFGNGVSFENNGGSIVIGAPQADIGIQTNAGAAYVFTRSGTVWTQAAKLQASDAQTNDNFGTAVNMRTAGGLALVGAPGEDTGGSNAGAVYIYTPGGGTWPQRRKFQPASASAGDQFGASFAESDDGLYLLIGAPGEKTAYTYYYNGSFPTYYDEVSTITFGTNIVGTSMALNFDGSISALRAETSPPSVVLFDRAVGGNTWTATSQIQINNETTFFGQDYVCLGGSSPLIIVIPDLGADAGAGSIQGAVYSFTL
jgi:hypothetical protein